LRSGQAHGDAGPSVISVPAKAAEVISVSVPSKNSRLPAGTRTGRS